MVKGYWLLKLRFRFGFRFACDLAHALQALRRGIINCQFSILNLHRKGTTLENAKCYLLVVTH
jgi:hypothetical protein